MTEGTRVHHGQKGMDGRGDARSDPGSALSSDVIAIAAKHRSLRSHVAAFATPNTRFSIVQFISSLGLFLLGCSAMHWCYPHSFLLSFALAFPTAGFLVRVFIIQHDCGHRAFLRSTWGNDLVGRICSLFTWTPYANWRRQHAQHHRGWNNLDRRESGADIYSSCLTVREYIRLSPWRRFVYRTVRHPLVSNIILPPLIFMILYRVPFDTPREWKRERRSAWSTSLAIAAFFAVGSFFLGFSQMMLVHVSIMFVASIVGVWLFSIQHRFEGAVWVRQAAWNPIAASLNSTSFLRLPWMLQWFTGSIGFHHIHHLNSRIPNYRLQECHQALPGLSRGSTVDLAGGLRALKLALWDEERGRLIGFSELRSR